MTFARQAMTDPPQCCKFAGVTVQATTDKSFDFVRFVFSLFDTDSSGTLDQEELHLMLRQLAVPVTEEQYDRVIEFVDKDNTGTLNVDEFIVLFYFLETGGFPLGHEPPEEFWDAFNARPEDDDNLDDKPAAEEEEEDDDDDDDDVKSGAAATAARGAAATAGGSAPGSSSASPPRRLQRTKVQNAVRRVRKVAMQGADLYNLFITQKSIHHFLARKLLTREARIAAAAQVRTLIRAKACATTWWFALFPLSLRGVRLRYFLVPMCPTGPSAISLREPAPGVLPCV